jgi:hypothetical protein
VEEVNYFDNEKQGRTRAVLEGINVGCRAAIIFSPFDLSCGWAGEIYPEGRHVAVHESRMMGLNLLCYSLAYYRLGREMSMTRVYKEDTSVPGEIVIGQIRHDGDWDPAPQAIPNLMRFVSQNTTGNVIYRRKTVNLSEDDLSHFPFLYLTGHLDFHFTDKERNVLKEYLDRGGFVLVSDCCNRTQFDQAVQREWAALLPDKPFALLPQDHPVYQNPFLFGKGSPADDEKSFRDLPPLYGIEIEGYTAVIYSRVSLGSAWDRLPRPYIPVPSPDLALPLGANIITYAMTH